MGNGGSETLTFGVYIEGIKETFNELFIVLNLLRILIPQAKLNCITVVTTRTEIRSHISLV